MYAFVSSLPVSSDVVSSVLRDEFPARRHETALPTIWRTVLRLTTDQEVGCSSRPGRAAEIHVVAGGFTCPVLVEGFEEADLWEPFA